MYDELYGYVIGTPDNRYYSAVSIAVTSRVYIYITDVGTTDHFDV